MKPETEALFKQSIEELLSESGYIHDIKWHIGFFKIMQELDSSIDQLRTSMERNADSSDELSKRVHRLNIVLTWATVVGSLAAVAGAIVAIIQLLKQLN